MLTHTNIAREVFQQQGRTAGGDLAQVSLRTFDGFACELAAAYRAALGLPVDLAESAIKQRGGITFSKIAELAGMLLTEYCAVADFVAARFPLIICDEHQDTSMAQWRIVESLRLRGATVHAFGDPMQAIYTFRRKHAASREAATPVTRESTWGASVADATEVHRHQTPYRWRNAPSLGDWIQEQRTRLMAGQPVLARPAAFLEILRADVERPEYRKDSFGLDTNAHRGVRRWMGHSMPCLFLTRYAHGVTALESAYRHDGLRIHEGTERENLHALAEATLVATTTEERARALCKFLHGTTVGFSKKYQNALMKAIAGHYKPTSDWGRAVAGAADYLLRNSGFRGVVDAIVMLVRARLPGVWCVRRDELQDAAFAARADSVDDGIAAARMRRARMIDAAPPRARASTIHGAKGLEADAVAILPCDQKEFPDTEDGRRLLYVALSRATRNILLVIPRQGYSALIEA